MLLIASLRTEGSPQTMLRIGALVQVLIFAVLALARRAWQEPIGQAVILLYLIGLVWLWISHGISDGWFSHLAQFLLLVVPLTMFALQTLTDSGAIASRRANLQESVRPTGAACPA